MNKSISLLLLILTSAACTGSEHSTTANDTSEAWPMFGRDLQNTNHYPHETGSHYKMAWSTRVGCPAPGMSSTIVDAHGMYNTSPCSNTGDTHAVGHDGDVLWSHGVGQGGRGIISTPCVHDGIVYTVDNGFLKALGAKDGNLIWKEKVTCGHVGLSSPIVYEGRLYLNGPKGIQVLSINRSQSDADAFITFSENTGAFTPAFHKGAMIVLSSKSAYSFDTKTLEQNWEVVVIPEGREGLSNAPVIDAKHGKIFAVSSIRNTTQGHLYCLKFENGEQLWKQPSGGVLTTPALTFDGNRVYVASTNGTVTAYNSDDGRQEWMWTLPGEAKQESGKVDFGRALRGIISTKNKLLFSTNNQLMILSNNHPYTIDFKIDLNGFSTPTPAFYNKDLYIRSRSREQRACNYRYVEVKEEPASDLEVRLVKNKAQLRNLTATKLSIYQFCYGINVNEKQNCVPYDLQLQPGEAAELDLERFLSVDEDIHHLLLCMEYEKPDGIGEFHDYFAMHKDATDK